MGMLSQSWATATPVDTFGKEEQTGLKLDSILGSQ